METTLRTNTFDYTATKDAAKTLRALNNKQRMRILRIIAESGRINVSSIYMILNIPQAVASQQLAVLRSAGIVIAERDSKKIFYSINSTKIGQVARLVTDATFLETEKNENVIKKTHTPIKVKHSSYFSGVY